MWSQSAKEQVIEEEYRNKLRVRRCTLADHLSQTVISKCCGHCAFEKATLVVEEEMRRLFSVSSLLVKEIVL